MDATVISLNQYRLSREGLKGIGLSALDAFLESFNDHINRNTLAKNQFNMALRDAVKSRAKLNKEDPIRIEITTSLDPSSKVITHCFKVQ